MRRSAFIVTAAVSILVALSEAHAQTNYDTFKANRRKDFIREAEDVEAEDGATTNGGYDYGTGQGPAPYASSPSVG